jgi:hypothetical protein
MTLNAVIGVEVEMNETMTPRMASPKTSSMTAVLIIILDSIILVRLSSCSTMAVIEMLVATSAAPTTKLL